MSIHLREMAVLKAFGCFIVREEIVGGSGVPRSKLKSLMDLGRFALFDQNIGR